MAFKVSDNVDLSASNTLALPVIADHYCEAHDTEAIAESVQFAKRHDLPLTILGGGSNVVLPPRIPGVTLHLLSNHIQQKEDVVTAAAGVNWHALVMQLCEKGLSGIENLAGIPGNVGAAPIQNIGAYGVQIADRILSVDVFDREDECERVLSRQECRFGYRDSIFKGAFRDRMIVTQVRLKLSSRFDPVTTYRDLQDAEVTSPLSMAKLVTQIRDRKLPNPARTPNVGSFFKNPVVSVADYSTFRETYPEAPVGVEVENGVKVHAAWLIEQCGLKQLRVGGAMVSEQHALVIVNTGEATYDQVRKLAEQVQRTVSDRFNLSLEFEPSFHGD